MSMARLLSISALVLLVAAPSHVIALTGPASRFDFLMNGRIPADATTNCNNEATARFDWSLGQPAIVYDATATCTAGGGGGATAAPQDVFWFD